MERQENSQPENFPDEKYIIHIDNFEGPLDLLWDLIKKSRLDVTEVSLSGITEQYIQYLRLMEELDVRVAVEFIWMASELLYYKSKSLLPSGEMEDEYFIPPLPEELVEKLLEYKRFQATSRDLEKMFEMRDNVFVRENDVESMVGADEYIDVSLFDLLRAFAGVMESSPVVEQEEILFDEILISERIDWIAGLLKDRESLIFHEIFQGRFDRPMIIATFLAILEMARTRMVQLMQHRTYGEIRIFRGFSVEDIQ